MTRRIVFPLLLGIVGTAILLALGTWQLQRLAWKNAIIDRIETRLAADPVTIPADPSAVEHQYLRVAEQGTLGGGELHVYTSLPGRGVGYRVIAPFDLDDGRRVLLDRGFVAVEEKDSQRATGRLAVAGALHWPQETDSWTPAPDEGENIWFGRDVEPMAAALGAEPVMLVVTAASPTLPDAPVPVPVTVNIPNNHLEYVVTWYGLAVVWAGMTLYWLWRIACRRDESLEGVAGRS